ncbi:MAG: hypothetical protein IKD87_04285 [Oscillospiraceae bacterium]|nr:hypothetical protein [Oscillospiraceae bacterium]
MTLGFEEFMDEVMSAIPDKLPEKIRNSRISIEEKTKNNDIKLHGIAILPEGMTAVPLFYLENYYDDYVRGMSADEIAGHIASQFEQYRDRASAIRLPDLDFESVSDRLRVRLVNSRSNIESLDSLVSRPVGCGFSLTSYIDLPPEAGVEGMIQVTRQLAELNGYDETLLMNTALSNSAKYEQPTLNDIADVLFGDGANDLLNGAEYEGGGSLYVLSHKGREYGAAALFYPGIQERIAEVLGEDYYVLPSSVHEVLIMPQSSGLSTVQMMDMVENVNRAELSAEDKLADKVLLYRRDLERLTVAEDREREPVPERESV